MAPLTEAQITQFRAEGYILAADAVSTAALAALKARLAGWVEEGASRDGPWGDTFDGRPRFDLAAGRDGAPASLRRVNNPVEVAACYEAAMADSAMTDMVAALIGPDVKFHHSKINLKQPGATTEVKYHQDFPYTPHTNADMVTALLMLDDMTLENGCLTVVPGSHREGVFSLWDGDRFTGTVAPEVEAQTADRVVPVTGRAGSVCLMHTLLLHGSAANRSDRPRALFISVYSAADAVPIAPSPLPNRFEGRIVRGRPTRRARVEKLEVELPERYQVASFFDIQQREAR